MSNSFLKPWVTPWTALARSARASPWRARCSSLVRTAVSTPFFCSNLITLGTRTSSFPLGPCTSTLPSVGLIFTPAGTGIGLRPIRDIFSILVSRTCSLAFCQTQLPDLAKNFAAHIRLARSAAGHQASRRRQDADTQPADHRPDVRRAEVAALAGFGYALHARNHTAAIRCVLQEDAEGLARLVFIDHFVSRDVALFFQDTGDLGLQARHGNVHPLVLCGSRVANARQEICDGIRL